MSKFSRQFLFLSVMLGMVLNPVLAALNCAANCGKFEQSVLTANTAEPSVELASTMSDHCQRMMQQMQQEQSADPAAGGEEVSDSEPQPLDANDNFSSCECVNSCGATAAALISEPHSSVTLFSPLRAESIGPQTVAVALVRNPYRPPIA